MANVNEYALSIKGQTKTYKVRGAGPREAFETVQGKVFPYTVDLIPTTSRGSADVRMELICGSRASVSYYKVTRRVGTVKGAEPAPDIKVPVAGKGSFEIMRCTDPTYPGVDVEFQPKDAKDSDGTLPRILFEYPVKGRLILHVWANKNSEDPTHTIHFN